MPVRHWKFVDIFQYLLPWFVLPILLLYTYLEIFHAPYLGFNFSPSTGRVQNVFIEPATSKLQVGDLIVSVGSTLWQEARPLLRESMWDEISPGETLSLLIERNEQRQQIEWRVAGFNFVELQARLLNIWPLAYVFWFAGLATTLLVRPRDTRSWLFTAFFALTAIWLVVGNTSRWHLWESNIVLRMAILLSAPVYLHLHWFFPKPLATLPKTFWQALYGVAIVAVILQWFEAIPRDTYIWVFIVALVGSAFLLLAHYIWQPSERMWVRSLLIVFLFAITPIVGLGIVSSLDAVPRLASAALLALPLIPGAYFYAIYRSQLGGLEFRANLLISLSLFFTLLGSVMAVLFALIDLLPLWPSKYLLSGVIVSLLAALSGIYLFPGFQRLVESRLLGIKLPPADLLEMYAARITTSLTQHDLKRLLQEEVLPSLLIRQSALLFNEGGKLTTLYSDSVTAPELPAYTDVADKADNFDLYFANVHQATAKDEQRGLVKFPWIRVAIPIRFEAALIGIWLFGRRDPDDLYNLAELTMLQTLAHQTAIALVNIEQAQQLRALYQANIERHETERAHLAHLLHDDILGGLSRLNTSLDAASVTDSYEIAYQSVKQHALQMITGLRPALLTYGLCAALEEVTDDLGERAGENVVVQFDVGPTAVQLPEKVEEYIFRIVQQACENSLRHSRASTIRLHGHITAEAVDLEVVDNGTGFDTSEGLSLAHLLTNKHFGLVGMHERAATIGAKLFIDSTLGRGTSVRVLWEAGSLPTNR